MGLSSAAAAETEQHQSAFRLEYAGPWVVRHTGSGFHPERNRPKKSCWKPLRGGFLGLPFCEVGWVVLLFVDFVVGSCLLAGFSSSRFCDQDRNAKLISLPLRYSACVPSRWDFSVGFAFALNFFQAPVPPFWATRGATAAKTLGGLFIFLNLRLLQIKQ